MTISCQKGKRRLVPTKSMYYDNCPNKIPQERSNFLVICRKLGNQLLELHTSFSLDESLNVDMVILQMNSQQQKSDQMQQHFSLNYSTNEIFSKIKLINNNLKMPSVMFIHQWLVTYIWEDSVIVTSEVVTLFIQSILKRLPWHILAHKSVTSQVNRLWF